MGNFEPIADYFLGRPVLSTRNPINAGWPIPVGYMGKRFIIDQIVGGEPTAEAFRHLAEIKFDEALVIASEDWVG